MDGDGSAERIVAWKSAAGIALLVAIFHAALFIVVPYERQDFPLSDDWAYALGAFSFLRGDGPRYCEWSANPLFGQWICASPFVYLLGETHQALRLSTATLHVLFAAALAVLLLRFRIRFGRMLALLIAFHPVMCLCSATYLSDLPTLAFSLTAIAYWMGPQRLTASLFGLTFGALAVSNRQTAVAAPLAILAVTIFARNDVNWRRLISPLLTVALGAAVAWWFSLPSDAARHPTRTPGLLDVMDVACCGFFFCGLGLLPASLGLVTWRRFLAGLGCSLALWICWAGACQFRSSWKEALFPMPQNHGNLLTDDGPFGDVYTVGASQPLFDEISRAFLTMSAIVGAGALLGAASRAPSGQWWNPVVLFGLAHLALPLVSLSQFDRYYLPLLIGAAFLLPGKNDESVRREFLLAPAFLLLWIGFSFALCRDLLTINAAKWELGNRAIASGIAISDIEGGLEWDFHHAWKRGRPPRVAATRREGFAVPFSLERLPHLTGRYAVSLRDDQRFQAIDRIRYRRWLPWGDEEVVLLKAW